MANIFQEAQLWSLAMLIPNDFVATDLGYGQRVSNLNTKLLGKQFCEQKANAIFRKLGQNILQPGFSNLPHDGKYPEWPSERCAIRQTDHQSPSDFILEWLERDLPQLRKTSPLARTWRELKKAAADIEFCEQPLIDWLHREQLFQYYANIGMPFGWVYSDVHQRQRQVSRKLRSTNPAKLNDVKHLDLVDGDLIVVRAAKNSSSDRYIAEMNNQNVMTLFPEFFRSTAAYSLSSIPVCENDEVKWLLRSQVALILHELFHSRSLLDAVDHIIGYTDEALQDGAMNDIFIKDRDDRFPTCGAPNEGRDTDSDHYRAIWGDDPHQHITLVAAYGLSACLELVRRDAYYGLSRAEENAESWALLMNLRMFTLVYPEFDFDISEWFVVIRTDELVHHCSLFDCLRHPDAGSIRDLPEYDRTKDPWRGKRLTNVKDLLKVVNGIVGEQLNKQDQSEERAVAAHGKYESARYYTNKSDEDVRSSQLANPLTSKGYRHQGHVDRKPKSDRGETCCERPPTSSIKQTRRRKRAVRRLKRRGLKDMVHLLLQDPDCYRCK